MLSMLKVRTAVYDWDNTLKIMLISSLYYIYTYHVLQGFFNKCTGKSTGILPVHDGNVAGARRRCFFGLSGPVQHRRPVLSGASLDLSPFPVRC